MAQERPDPTPPGGNPGPGVDAYGQPVIDPSPNVLDLVRAAMQRQDDLREMQARYDAQVGKMREVHSREMRAAARRSEERLDQKDQQIRLAETARIDAIRAVDVGAVNRAAEVSAAQAATLATQVATSAEALRGQVEAARQQTATSLAQALSPITKSIEDLRAAQYQQQGEKTQRGESGTDSRDALAVEAAKIQATQAIEAAKIQAAQVRMQMYALVIAALVLALGAYAALHH
jgi:hypothetical protein